MHEQKTLTEHRLLMTRRQLFGRASLGLGTASLASLLGRDLLAASREDEIAGERPGAHDDQDQVSGSREEDQLLAQYVSRARPKHLSQYERRNQ